MNKERIKSAVFGHYRFFKFISSAYNFLLPKNRLHVNGLDFSCGVTVLNGLKIINKGVGNSVRLGDFVRMKNCKIIIYGNNNSIYLSDYTFFKDVEFYLENDRNCISVGEHTSLCGSAHLAAIEGTKIFIGKNCLFSSDLHFRTGDSHSILDSEGRRINPSEDIIIDDHVWLGTKVTRLKGVHISRDSIVAATTTLCKDYDVRNAIIAGVPGKIVRIGVNWCHKRIPVDEPFI